MQKSSSQSIFNQLRSSPFVKSLSDRLVGVAMFNANKSVTRVNHTPTSIIVRNVPVSRIRLLSVYAWSSICVWLMCTFLRRFLTRTIDSYSQLPELIQQSEMFYTLTPVSYIQVIIALFQGKTCIHAYIYQQDKGPAYSIKPLQELDRIVLSIECNRKLNSQVILSDIDEHRKSLKRSGMVITKVSIDWYHNKYQHIIRLINKYNLLMYFPNYTEVDLYVWILAHLNNIEQQYIEFYLKPQAEPLFRNALIEFIHDQQLQIEVGK